MGEFRVTDQGELDLGLSAPAASPRPAARPPRRTSAARAGAACPPGATQQPCDLPAGDDWLNDDWPAGEIAGWDWEPTDDGDPDISPDDYQAWLAGLPADVRADYLAGPWTGAGETIPAGFLHHLAGGPSGAGFAAGGVLDTLAPGPWLADALATATATADGTATAATGGHAGLGESELIGVLCGWRRIASWAAAGEAAAVVTLARRRAAADTGPGSSRQAEHVTDEIAAALTLTSRSAGRLLAVASGLARTPDVLAALKQGGIDWPKACVFADELAVLDDGNLAAGIAGRYLGRVGAGGWTTGQLRAALRRAVLAADPDAADRRRDDARADAAVTTWDEASGNAGLAGRELPPAEVLAADARLTALAKWLQARGAPGTISQLRAAVYTALLNGRPVDSLLSDPADPSTDTSGPAAAGGVPGGDAPAEPAVSGSIHLTMPVSAFAGGGEPGEVAGHGPVDAATSRDLAALLGAGAGTRWCLTLTGPGGRPAAHACASAGPAAGQPVIRWAAGLRSRLQVLETGSCGHPRQAPGYAPPNALRHLIGIRQRRCSHPGCRRPAVRCDLDHTIPYDQGGRTCECNLAPLCRHHHRCKQAEGWHLTQPRPGQMTWRTPSGRVYETVGDPY
jgi:hypothetical protein